MTRALPFRRPERGGALLITLVSVTILTSLAVAVYSQAAAARVNARAYLVTERNRLGLRSGIEAARAVLEQKILPGLSPLDPTGRNTLEVRLSLGETNVYLVLQDESGKVSLRRGPEAVSRLQEAVGAFGAKVPMEVSKALARVGSTAGKIEAPDAVPTWGEVLEKTGIEPALAFGVPKFEEETSIPKPREAALADLVTPFADPKVNLNTASAEALFSIHSVLTPKIVEEVVGYRKDRGSFARPFQAAEDLQSVPGIVEREIVEGKERVTKNLFLSLKDRVTVQGGPFTARIWAKTRERVDGAVVLFRAATSSPSGGVIPVSGGGASPGSPSAQAKVVLFEEFSP